MVLNGKEAIYLAKLKIPQSIVVRSWEAKEFVCIARH